MIRSISSSRTSPLPSSAAGTSAVSPRPFPSALRSMRHDLLGQGEIRLRPSGHGVIKEGRLAVARRLGQRDIAGDGALEHLLSEVRADFAQDLIIEVVATVE